MAAAAGVRRGLLFPKAGEPEEPWIKHDWDNWREDVYQPAARAVGITDPSPYDLRAAFVSLLAWEGYTMLEVVADFAADLRCRPRHDSVAARLGVREDFGNPVAVGLAVADDLAPDRQAAGTHVALDVEGEKLSGRSPW